MYEEFLAVGIVVFLVVGVLYATGRTMAGNTADERDDVEHFYEPGIWGRDQDLICLTCDYRHIFSPENIDCPLWCPRCGLPLTDEGGVA